MQELLEPDIPIRGHSGPDKAGHRRNKGGRGEDDSGRKRGNQDDVLPQHSTQDEGGDDIFIYLCHLGYLCYDPGTGTCRIPNREVRDEWINAIEGLEEYAGLLELICNSKRLLQSTLDMDAPGVAQALERSRQRMTSPLSCNNERSFQSAIRLAYLYAERFCTPVFGYPLGKGYADIAFIPFKPDLPALVAELKVRGAAGTAIDRIRERRYFAGLEHHEGNTLLVAISYDKGTKAHECLIEKA